jgi:membrane-bound ClpP family serine protease
VCIVSTPQYPGSAQPLVTPPSARPGNGLGVAALVLGVASLVAAVSFVLFPLGLLGGLVAVVLGGIAVARGRTKGAANPGQAVAGIVCGVLALIVGIVFAVRFGTFVARNTSVFTTFDNCIARAANRSAVANCIARLANDIRP